MARNEEIDQKSEEVVKSAEGGAEQATEKLRDETTLQDRLVAAKAASDSSHQRPEKDPSLPEVQILAPKDAGGVERLADGQMKSDERNAWNPSRFWEKFAKSTDEYDPPSSEVGSKMLQQAQVAILNRRVLEEATRNS